MLGLPSCYHFDYQGSYVLLAPKSSPKANCKHSPGTARSSGTAPDFVFACARALESQTGCSRRVSSAITVVRCAVRCIQAVAASHPTAYFLRLFSHCSAQPSASSSFPFLWQKCSEIVWNGKIDFSLHCCSARVGSGAPHHFFHSHGIRGEDLGNCSKEEWQALQVKSFPQT